jgi:ATPase family protein associated with various cellular activities (AAA)
VDTQPLDFRELADLRLFLHDLRNRQVESLEQYYDKDSGGFYHRHDERIAGKLSRSSTATCVLSLVATNQWSGQPWYDSSSNLVDRLLTAEWVSAGLPENNLFTVSFILEATQELLTAVPAVQLSDTATARLTEAQQILAAEVRKEPVKLSVQGYPPSAYVAQLVVRTLQKSNLGWPQDATESVSNWAEREINKQIALLTRNDKTADVFQLAYAAILLTNLVEPASVTPDQDFILDAALEVLFERQRDDGTWPLSRPLFHYPSVGSAHCYDYEMLVQLLGEPKLQTKLLQFIPKLARSARALRSSFPLGATGKGWSSGHHPQLKGPESWSTASVYHFAHALERLLAEQIRIATFALLGNPYSPPRQPKAFDKTLPSYFLDCEVRLDGAKHSLKHVIAEKILAPLIEDEQKGRVASGEKLSKRTPVSMIFFGPPGTSKTDLARLIAERLGWPLLSVDASQFLKNGMDGVYAEADKIFGMLAVTERVIVLLDEFDEMVRARETAPDVLSRFLTTAMLPKLHKIHDNRRLVFIVATNHIDWFDVAIRRPGRFDVILQVMPPTADEKLRKWGKELSVLTVEGMTEVDLKIKLEPLTFLETDNLVTRVREAPDLAAKVRALETAYRRCTLQNPVQPDASISDAVSPAALAGDLEETAVSPSNTTWQTLCDNQAALTRVL